MRNDKSCIFVFIALLSFMVSSCTNNEGVLRRVITDNIKGDLTNPKTLKIESLHILEDTVPYYFNIAVKNAAMESVVAFDEYEKYQDRSDYWKDEKAVTAMAFYLKQRALIEVCDSIVTKTGRDVESIACVKYAYKDAMGDIVTKKCVYIISKDNPEKILTTVEIDSDLLKQVLLAKMTAEGFELKQDQYGETDLSGLPYVECFMFEDI